jgi:hypothetical protein
MQVTPSPHSKQTAVRHAAKGKHADQSATTSMRLEILEMQPRSQ